MAMPAVSPEMIQATLTALPILVSVWWGLAAVGALYRRSLWEAFSPGLIDLARRLGGDVEPLWNGWRVRAVDARIDLRGGIVGVRLVVKGRGRETALRSGMTEPEQVLEQLARV